MFLHLCVLMKIARNQQPWTIDGFSDNKEISKQEIVMWSSTSVSWIIAREDQVAGYKARHNQA